MARQLRIQYEGALYHIMSRGNAQMMIFHDDADRIKFLNIFHKTIKRFTWLCHAYCLMGNHYHLLIETPDANLAKGMKYLNQVYTQFFNYKYHRVGHVLQGRYKAIIVQKDTYLLHCCRYIALNPWDAKLVEHPSGWPWSSYGATAGLVKTPPLLTTGWLLEQFGFTVKKARENYVRFVEADMDGFRTKLDIRFQLFLGSDEFIKNILKQYGPMNQKTGINNTQLSTGRLPLAEVFSGMNGSRKLRNQAILQAYRTYKYPLKEIASHLSMNPNYLCQIIKALET
ncbi:MAG: addiction module toxin RelE [Deltaproteobacteria bacterium]|nr:addiction module toxin RelE [Deltaproteobacteria bacterium]